jgi:hypothetical protein
MMLEIAEGYECLAKHVSAKKHYFTRDVHSWDDFVGIVSGHEGQWVYRGQRKGCPLPSLRYFVGTRQICSQDIEIPRAAGPVAG